MKEPTTNPEAANPPNHGEAGAAAPPAAAPPPPASTFRMVLRVLNMRLRFIALLVVLFVIVGYWDRISMQVDRWVRGESRTEVAESDIEYSCPMHSQVVRAEPGLCPICNMPLSQRQRGERQELPAGVTARVSLSPERVAAGGTRTVAARYEPLEAEIHTVGFVEYDERRLARITARVPGRIERLYVDFTGRPVEPGEPLVDIYSPELSSAVSELITWHERLEQNSANGTIREQNERLFEGAQQRLRQWGLTQEQIDDFYTHPDADHSILTIYAPPLDSQREGRAETPEHAANRHPHWTVTHRAVAVGDYVAQGDVLLEIADLSRVWLRARVYEDDLPLVRVRQRVTASTPSHLGEQFEGTVDFIDPTVDRRTRTVGVRLDFANPEGLLLPGAYIHATLRTPIAELPAFRATAVAATEQPLAADPDAAIAWQRICPVTERPLGSMGDPVLTGVEMDGLPVYVCCQSCKPTIERRPDEYFAVLREHYDLAHAQRPEGSVLAVPETAVVHVGNGRTVVYVEREEGVFDGIEVQLGPRAGGWYPVLSGLAPGDRVAASGAFLIDAETRLNPGAAAAYFGASGSSQSGGHSH